MAGAGPWAAVRRGRRRPIGAAGGAPRRRLAQRASPRAPRAGGELCAARRSSCELHAHCGRASLRPNSSSSRRAVRARTRTHAPRSHTTLEMRALEAPTNAHRRTDAPPHQPASVAAQGVNIMAFCKEYNAATAKMAGDIIPVEITVYEVGGAILYCALGALGLADPKGRRAAPGSVKRVVRCSSPPAGGAAAARALARRGAAAVRARRGGGPACGWPAAACRRQRAGPRGGSTGQAALRIPPAGALASLVFACPPPPQTPPPPRTAPSPSS